MVKISPSGAGVVGLIPGREAKTPHAYQQKKKQNRSNIVTNSRNALKNDPYIFKKWVLVPV